MGVDIQKTGIATKLLPKTASKGKDAVMTIQKRRSHGIETQMLPKTAFDGFLK